MQDENLVDLCKTIYRKHREAINLIVEYGSSSQALDTCEANIRALVQCEYFARTGQYLFFLPNQLGALQPELPMSGWQHLPRRVPVVCWFYHYRKQGKLQATMEVGPLEDSALRIRLLTSIKEAGFSFREKGAFKEGAKYTRILTVLQELRTGAEGGGIDAPDDIANVTKSLWKKLWAKGEKIVGVLEALDWGG